MNIQSWTTADIPNLEGRVAVVTGANGGLGLETARALAGAGAHVVMAARDQAKAAAAEADIRSGVPGASLEVAELDLGSLESVAAAAGAISSRHPALDILVNNAGLMGIPERHTADGFEMQFGVDHLGHYALTAQLLPNVLAAPGARVVTVTSTAHHLGARSTPRTRTCAATTAPGSPTSRPSSPTSTSGWGSSNASRARAPARRACSPIRACRTRTCRSSARARRAGSGRASSPGGQRTVACRPRAGRCRSCARRPTRRPKAGSSTARGT